MSRHKTNNLLGIGLMMLAMFLFGVMDAIAKWLVVANMSAIQIIAVRSWIIVVMIPLVLAVRGELAELATRQPVQHALRGMVGFLAPFSFFTSLETLPLADATVVFFSATFILTAASAIFLKERVGIHRWSAVVVGFGGVVVAMNPQGGGPIGAYLLVLCAASIYSMIFIYGKQLSKRDSIITLVFSLQLGMGIIATTALPWVWVPIGIAVSGQLLLMAMIALVAHYLFATAFARADVSALAPFEYTALVWATIIGYVVWHEIPSTEVWMGAAIIIACGLYVIRRESLRHRALSRG
ncbi:MAG: DMT family transporter [Gammaproteobacteria bacterium]|nr:DMT family transporter [Gammaproteobacteria bacterium]